MIIATDAGTFRAKVEAKLNAELEVHKAAICYGSTGIQDYAAYRFEVGYITALTTMRGMMDEVVRETNGDTA